jgi:hypothetical protein
MAMDEVAGPFHISNALRRIDERLHKMIECCAAGEPVDPFEVLIIGRQALAQAEMLKAGLVE